ncbi:hypothetical protein [Kitasatospora griseola]|uniref:hypothetical protein n=1 Tax=Kitasatospora griseola TaxID=2064 RepID=UPI0038299017
MTSVHLHPVVAEAFPDARIALVTARGIRGAEPWPETVAVMELLAPHSAVVEVRYLDPEQARVEV